MPPREIERRRKNIDERSPTPRSAASETAELVGREFELLVEVDLPKKRELLWEGRTFRHVLRKSTARFLSTISEPATSLLLANSTVVRLRSSHDYDLVARICS